METDGGGCIVFQRREDGSVDFNCNQIDYKEEFGNLTEELFGKIYCLTNINALQIELENFKGENAFANYSSFSIRNYVIKFTLIVSAYSGNVLDSMSVHNVMMFTTKDRGNDKSGGICGISFNVIGGFVVVMQMVVI